MKSSWTTSLSDIEPSTIKNFDLAIIDAVALREVNVPSTQLLSAVQGWKIPKIWIDEGERVQAPSRHKCYGAHETDSEGDSAISGSDVPGCFLVLKAERDQPAISEADNWINRNDGKRLGHHSGRNHYRAG